MGFDYEEAGDFASEHAAREWAERNAIDPTDLHLRNRGSRGVTLSVRRSALGDTARSDLTYGRRTGFFS
jgi:CO/xanthine dehydrogenase Mo-binding subunit